MNLVRTTMLLAALTALFMALGFTVGGWGGALIALAVAGVMNLFTYWNADKIVLKMHGAREVDAALVKSRLEGGERFVEIDDEEGKPSRSRFVPQAHYRDATLCEVEIYSGRTHQIRVHMAHIGHPLIGDPEYGAAFKTKANRLPDAAKAVVNRFHRQALHAYLLAFEHPRTGEVMEFEAPVPADLEELLEAMREG